jgi:hypothetical protein
MQRKKRQSLRQPYPAQRKHVRPVMPILVGFSKRCHWVANSLGKKKQSILGIGLPSSFKFGSVRTTATSSVGSSQPTVSSRRSSLNLLTSRRPSSTMSNSSSLRPTSTISEASRQSSSGSNASVRWDEEALQTVKEMRRAIQRQAIAALSEFFPPLDQALMLFMIDAFRMDVSAADTFLAIQDNHIRRAWIQRLKCPQKAFDVPVADFIDLSNDEVNFISWPSYGKPRNQAREQPDTAWRNIRQLIAQSSANDSNERGSLDSDVLLLLPPGVVYLTRKLAIDHLLHQSLSRVFLGLHLHHHCFLYRTTTAFTTTYNGVEPHRTERAISQQAGAACFCEAAHSFALSTITMGAWAGKDC